MPASHAPVSANDASRNAITLHDFRATGVTWCAVRGDDLLKAIPSETASPFEVGGKRRLVIPYDLDNGEKGSPPKIPEKAALKFDIELMDVK